MVASRGSCIQPDSKRMLESQFLMIDANSSTAGALLAIAEQVGRVLVVIASLLFVVSVFFDYSFLLAVGVSFDEIPSSLSEHVRSAILWTPKLLLTVLAFFTYELFLRRIEGGMSEEELITSSSTPRFISLFRKSGDLVVPVVGLLTVLVGTFLSNDLQWAYLLFALLWWGLALSVVNHPRLGTLLVGLQVRLFVILPILLSMVGLYGYQSGIRILTTTKPKWEVVLRDGSTTTKQSLLGIRRFGSFAIIVDQAKLVSIIPNESIVSVRIYASPVENEINICRWFGVLCQFEHNPFSKPEIQETMHDKVMQPLAPR